MLPVDPRIEQLESRISELELALASRSESAPEPKTPANSQTMHGAWGANGYTAETPNGAFRVHIGGRVQADAVALSTDDLILSGEGDRDAVNFRRARLRVDGVMYRTMEWAAEFDFVNAFDVDPLNGPTPVNAIGGDTPLTIAPTDLWWAIHEIPWIGNVRIGNHKEPIGLEHLNSSRFLDFMERSYLQDAFFGPFNNGFTPGVSVFDCNESETVTWALGGYKNTQNIFGYDTGDNEYALTARVTCVPWSDCDDRRLIHLGLGTSYRGFDQDADPSTGNMRVRTRASLRNGPPSGLNPSLADTNFVGRMFVESQTLIAPEVAVVAGPWLWQAEYVAAFANSTTFTPSGGTPVSVGRTYSHGAYVQALYFLTGEHRVYERR
ncbi:MAG TPA: porin, partial [Lacipirellulaceae bacterium]|nr:porin [Lacipirellulaceae bacterium]